MTVVALAASVREIGLHRHLVVEHLRKVIDQDPGIGRPALRSQVENGLEYSAMNRLRKMVRPQEPRDLDRSPDC